MVWHLPPIACVHVTHDTWKMESKCEKSEKKFPLVGSKKKISGRKERKRKEMRKRKKERKAEKEKKGEKVKKGEKIKERKKGNKGEENKREEEKSVRGGERRNKGKWL